MRRFLIGLLCFCGAAVIVGLVRGDQTVTTKPSLMTKLEAKVDAKKLMWKTVDGVGLIDFGGKIAAFQALAPGKYPVFVIGAKGDEPLIEVITIIVEGELPKPPPGPGPGPNPPVPDPPSPTDDALLKPLQAAFSQERIEDKASLSSLADLYKAASESTVNDQSILTLWRLNFVMKKARESLMQDTLPKTRAVLNGELDRLFGVDPAYETPTSTPFTNDMRRKTSDLFLRFSKLLRTLK